MTRKRFVWGKWRVVLENGVIGAPCPTPSEEDQELYAAQERAAGLDLVPLILKSGEQCPICGKELEYLENKKCAKCRNDFYVEVSAPEPGQPQNAPPTLLPNRPPPGSTEYKVLTQRDEFFKSKFNPEALEQLINRYAAEGWNVVSMTATDVGSFWGSFWTKGGGAARQELIVLLERKVPTS